MTKPRQPDTFQDAMLEIVRALGDARCGEILLLTGRQVRKWTDPDTNEYPRADQMWRLDQAYIAATGKEPPLLRVYLRRLRLSGARPTAGDLLAEALDVPAAVGRFAELLRRARGTGSDAGGRFSAAEKRALTRALAEIQRECEDVQRSLK